MLLPKEAGCISFSHFLEVSFGLQHCIVNKRPLHYTFARYFGLGSTVACFHYEAVAPNVVLMPDEQIRYNLAVHQDWLEEEAEQLIEVTFPLWFPLYFPIVMANTVRTRWVGYNINRILCEQQSLDVMIKHDYIQTVLYRLYFLLGHCVLKIDDSFIESLMCNHCWDKIIYRKRSCLKQEQKVYHMRNTDVVTYRTGLILDSCISLSQRWCCLQKIHCIFLAQ